MGEYDQQAMYALRDALGNNSQQMSWLCDRLGQMALMLQETNTLLQEAAEREEKKNDVVDNQD